MSMSSNHQFTTQLNTESIKQGHQEPEVREDEKLSRFRIFQGCSSSSPSSPDEYEDLEKELNELDARVSNDEGLRDLFTGDDDKNEEPPRESLKEVYEALPLEVMPPPQLQLDLHEEASQMMPAKKVRFLTTEFIFVQCPF